MYLTTERLYVNKDYSQVVPEGSTEAAYLLADAGKFLPDEVAAKYGLVTPVLQPADGVELPAEVQAASGEGAPQDTGELTPAAEAGLVSGEKTQEPAADAGSN